MYTSFRGNEMGRTLEEVEKYAMELSVEDRAVLRDRLGASLHEMEPETEKAWAVEVERRIQEIEDGTVDLQEFAQNAMRRFSLHPLAERELEESEDHYFREGGNRLAVDFIDEFEYAKNVIFEDPERWAVHTARARRYLMDRFHFSIFYYLRPDHIYIIAIAHQARRPGYWLDRVDDIPIHG